VASVRIWLYRSVVTSLSELFREFSNIYIVHIYIFLEKGTYLLDTLAAATQSCGLQWRIIILWSRVRPSPPPASCVNQYSCDTIINTSVEYCCTSYVTENATTTSIFSSFSSRTFFAVGGIGSDGGGGLSDTARGRWRGQFLRKCRRRWRHDVDAYLRGRTDGRRRGTIDPMLRVVIKKPLSPAMWPTCRPHKTLPNCRSAAPPPPVSFCFPSPRAHTPAHARTCYIRSDCTLTLTRHYTGAWKQTYIPHTLTCRYARVACGKTTEEGKNENGVQIGLCILVYII